MHRSNVCVCVGGERGGGGAVGVRRETMVWKR